MENKIAYLTFFFELQGTKSVILDIKMYCGIVTE